MRQAYQGPRIAARQCDELEDQPPEPNLQPPRRTTLTGMRGAATCLLSCLLLAQDWPQFRGPDGQGRATGDGFPVQWSETQNVAWKVPVPGRGWSSPIVAGGRVWLTTAMQVGKDTSLRLLAFEADSGRAAADVEVFKMRGNLLNAKNSHASPTPIAAGDRVYVHLRAQGTASGPT